MGDFRLLSILFAGICSGAVLGAAIPTETERKIRHSSSFWLMPASSSLTRVVLTAIIKMILLLSIFAVIGIFILNITGAYPLCQPHDKQILTWSWLGGAGLAKWGRYIYWKRKDPWL